jgi:hypothetical protein
MSNYVNSLKTCFSLSIIFSDISPKHVILLHSSIVFFWITMLSLYLNISSHWTSAPFSTSLTLLFLRCSFCGTSSKLNLLAQKPSVSKVKWSPLLPPLPITSYFSSSMSGWASLSTALPSLGHTVPDFVSLAVCSY